MHLIGSQIFTMIGCEAPINAHPVPISVQQYSNLMTYSDKITVCVNRA